ncbi:putative NADH-cytochrome b5 reductase [Trypanosoma cruzi]|uniref:Putative NADH-cytochrome b5 reductase n=1 Tax=Trypanosoma cruzi TaxID=5693 RepID=A0A2V2V2J5_TRYCR|nr:NADH-cytochrome b5 reductase [Trypanosoma cruzi cruzi]PWU88623.1 putative NADH-cytochrome b5 reductase [Trypanosoma cruzi]RNF20793.1 putative NADH-cytochrome b5 reductase [Trypanosoma cruzi]
MGSRGAEGGGGPSSDSSWFGDGSHREARWQKRQSQRGTPRWSYELQDIPKRVRNILNDVNVGYAARLLLACGVAGGVVSVLYYAFFVRLQESRPLAKRSRFAPLVPVTLIEKDKVNGSSMVVLRFALPNSYDYCGYEPVSSVRVTSGTVRGMGSVSRWYTPISHPEQRGIVEFAIKDRDPGVMSARLRYLERGDRVYLGRWMKEFPYKKNTYGELGLISTTSGASIALQLMKVLDSDKSDRTKLYFLYCHHTAKDIPFRETFDAYARRNPDRISSNYNVFSLAKQTRAQDVRLGENFFLGNIDPTIVEKALPPPAIVDPATGNIVRPKILICGPQSMLLPLCGRVSTIGNYSYWQGPFYKYCGFLRDMGYTRSQVYKFGVSTNILAYQ